MRYVSGAIGAIFLGLLMVHIAKHPVAHWLCNLFLAAGAGVALMTLKAELPRMAARVLAIGTVALMFVFFAGFFQMVPEFQKGWYRNELAVEAVSQLVAAFMLIPVLANYSCRLKAGHGVQQTAGKKQKAAFFSVPS